MVPGDVWRCTVAEGDWECKVVSYSHSPGVRRTQSGVMLSTTCLLIKGNPAVACVLGVSVCAQLTLSTRLKP